MSSAVIKKLVRCTGKAGRLRRLVDSVEFCRRPCRKPPFTLD